MTRTRRALALLLAVMLCVAAIHAWWPDARAGVDSAAAPGTTASASVSAPAPRPADSPPAAPAIDVQALPAVGEMRVADVLPSLQAQADAGDAVAACRLGIELLRCAHLPAYTDRYVERVKDTEARHERSGKLDEANQAAGILLNLAELRRTCDGVPEDQIARGGHYLRQAALAGVAEARLRYVRGQSLGPMRDMAYIRHPGFETWRREAHALLAQALSDGEPGAVLLMLESHSGIGSPLTLITPPDALAAATAQTLTTRLFGEQVIPDGIRPGVATPPDLFAEAELRANDLHQRHFGGDRHPVGPAAVAFMQLHETTDAASWPFEGQPPTLGQGCLPGERR